MHALNYRAFSLSLSISASFFLPVEYFDPLVISTADSISLNAFVLCRYYCYHHSFVKICAIIAIRVIIISNIISELVLRDVNARTISARQTMKVLCSLVLSSLNRTLRSPCLFQDYCMNM